MEKILNKTILFPFCAFAFSHFHNKRISCTFTYLVPTMFLLQTAVKYFVILSVNLCQTDTFSFYLQNFHEALVVFQHKNFGVTYENIFLLIIRCKKQPKLVQQILQKDLKDTACLQNPLVILTKTQLTLTNTTVQKTFDLITFRISFTVFGVHSIKDEDPHPPIKQTTIGNYPIKGTQFAF